MTELDRKWTEFTTNAAKAAQGNKSAGVRARKASLELTQMLKNWRAESLKTEKAQ